MLLTLADFHITYSAYRYCRGPSQRRSEHVTKIRLEVN